MLFVTMFINFVLNGIRLEFIILPLISFLYLWNFHFFINIILICICVLFFFAFLDEDSALCDKSNLLYCQLIGLW